MPPRTTPKTPTLDAIFEQSRNRAQEARELEEAQRGGGDGFLDDVTGLVSKGLAKGANGLFYGLSAAGKVLDLPRQWVSKPLLGAAVATFTGRWNEIGSYNDLRTMWDDIDLGPASGVTKFVAELGTDPFIFFGGFGLFKGTGARLATMLMHSQGVKAGTASGFKAARAAWQIDGTQGIQAIQKAIVAGRSPTVREGLEAGRVMQKAGLVPEGLANLKNTAKWMTNVDLRMVRSMKVGAVARRTGMLSRILGPAEVTWEAMWNAPVSLFKPMVMKAGRPIGKSLGFGINAFGRTQLFRRATGFMASRSNFAREIGSVVETGKIGREIAKGLPGPQTTTDLARLQAQIKRLPPSAQRQVGRITGDITSWFTRPTAESVKRLAYDQTTASLTDTTVVAAKLGISEREVLTRFRLDDPDILNEFRKAAPGLGPEGVTASMETLTRGLKTMAPEDFEQMLIRAAEGGDTTFKNMFREGVERGLRDDFGVVEVPEIAQPPLIRGLASILNAMRPTILARPDFALVESMDNFIRAGNVFALTADDFEFLGRHGLPEQLSAGKIGVGESFLDALLPFRKFREVRVAGRVARGITKPLSKEEIKALQLEIDELPEEVAKDIGAFIAAPNARLEALEEMPFIPDLFKRFVKGYQRRMASVDGRAAALSMWEAASDDFIKTMLSLPPQTVNRSQAAIQSFLQRVEDSGINPNAMQLIRRNAQRILAGEPGALQKVAKVLNLNQMTLADFTANPAFLRLSKQSRFMITEDAFRQIEDGVPAAFAVQSALRRWSHTAYETVGEGATRKYGLVKTAQNNLFDVFKNDLNIDRAAQVKGILGAHNNTIKRLERLEKKLGINRLVDKPLVAERRAELEAEKGLLKKQVQNQTIPYEEQVRLQKEGELTQQFGDVEVDKRIGEIDEILASGKERVDAGTSWSKNMRDERLTFEISNDDIDLTTAGSLSTVAGRKGSVAAEYLPFMSYDSELAAMVDNRLHNGFVHLEDYINLVNKGDSPGAMASLKKMAKLFPELQGLVDNGVVLPPTMLAQTFADINVKTWRRYLTAKVVASDELVARATSRAGRFDSRSYRRLLGRTFKEVIGSRDLGVVRLKAATDNMARYGFTSDMLPALESAEQAYPALADALMEKWKVLTPRGMIKEVDDSLRQLNTLTNSYISNQDYNRQGVDAVMDIMREGDIIARDPLVKKEMALRFSHSMQTAGIQGWRNKMVDYRYQTGVDRLAGFFSLFPVWGLRLPGYLARQFVERPGYIFGMNHLIQSGEYGDLGLGFGGGFFWAPHLRMSTMPIIARKGQSYVFEGDHPVNQIGNFFESLGFYPGPRMQLATATVGGFLNQTGISTGQSKIDPQFVFGTLPEFRWLRDISATMGINEAQGFQIPFVGGSNSLFDRAVEQELASRITQRIQQGQAQAGRELFPDEIVDIRNSVRAEELVSARRSVAARDFALSQLPGLRYVSPEETSTIDAVRERLERKGVETKRTRGGVIQGFRKLSKVDQQQVFAEVPGFKEFISLPNISEDGKARNLRQAKEGYFRTVDSIWAPVGRQQRLLDQRFEADEITPKEWRDARSDARTQAVFQVEGLRQQPDIQAWLNRAQKGIDDDPVAFATREFQQLEPVDIDGDGLVLRDDMKAFFDARRNFLARQPVWVQEQIKQQHQASLTPLEVQYEATREHLDAYYDIPRYQGMSLEASERASKVIAQANVLSRATPGEQPLIQTIMRLPGVSGEDKNLAILALNSGRNLARAQFWVQFPGLNVFFPDLAPGGLELAG